MGLKYQGCAGEVFCEVAGNACALEHCREAANAGISEGPSLRLIEPSSSTSCIVRNKCLTLSTPTLLVCRQDFPVPVVEFGPL